MYQVSIIFKYFRINVQLLKSIYAENLGLLLGNSLNSLLGYNYLNNVVKSHIH